MVTILKTKERQNKEEVLSQRGKGLIISEEEWQRISKRQEQPPPYTSRELKDVSQKMTATWVNTIQKPQYTRVESLQKKRQQELQQRKEEDQQLIQKQAEEKAAVIQKARQLLYNQSAPIRSLHRAILASEVLQERNFQLKLKSRIDDAEKYRERVCVRKEKERLREWERNEKRLREQKQQQKHDLRTNLQNQIDYHLQEEQQRVNQEKAERRRMQKKAELGEKLAAKQRIKNEIDKAGLRKIYDEHTLALRSLREAEEKHERKNEDIRLQADRVLQDIRNTAIAKREQIKKMKREYVTEYGKSIMDLHKKRQKQFEAWIKRLEEYNDARLEAEQKQREAAREKRTRHILKQWDNAMMLMNEQKANDEKQKRQMYKKIQKDCHEFNKYKQIQKQKQLQDGKELLHTHQNQAREAAARKAAAKECLKEYMEDVHNQQMQEQRQFMKYALDLIKERQEAGRNAMPLIKAIQEQLEEGQALKGKHLIQEACSS